MRRKDKFILIGGTIGAGIVALIDILSQWLKHQEKHQPFTWESYDGKQTLKNGFWGFAAGAGIGYLAYEYTLSNEANHPFNSDEYLRKRLVKERLKSDPNAFAKVLRYREKVKTLLAREFSGLLVCPPEDAGSFRKGTAIASNYDLDIILPFKKNSFQTLERMFDEVYDIVDSTFGNEATVMKRTKAIEVSFDDGDEPLYFDIVPGREINNYKVDRDLNLYIRPDWVWQRGSSFKTNTRSQQQIVRDKPQAKAVIKLIKSYRDKNSFDLSGIIIDQCVVEAMRNDNYGVHPSLTENLLNSMEYLSKQITNKQMADHANTNNNLNDKHSDLEREEISDLLIADIEKIENNPRYIKEVFEN